MLSVFYYNYLNNIGNIIYPMIINIVILNDFIDMVFIANYPAFIQEKAEIDI